jgi:hypothetical protein
MAAAPVVLFVFNRPDLTRLVVNQIRAAAPTDLYLVADGPRTAAERDVCQAARAAVLDSVDWPCEIHTQLADTNLGCRARLSSGLDWVFEHVESAIVLEDDCVPVASFFTYCDELLNRYRDDERVMHIGGSNLAPGLWRSNASYRFSANAHVWGWATWRRAWKHYDVNMRAWPALARTSFLRNVTTSRGEAAYYEDAYDRTTAGEIDTWDYQWQFACWTQSGLGTVPQTSLVRNVGFRADGTHTQTGQDLTQGIVGELEAITHPDVVVRDRELDSAVFQRMVRSWSLKHQLRERSRWALDTLRSSTRSR